MSYRKLVSYLLKSGCAVSVDDGEDWAVIRSTKSADILAAIESVNECRLVVSQDGERRGMFLIVPDLDSEEQIADHSDNDFCNAAAAAANA